MTIQNNNTNDQKAPYRTAKQAMKRYQDNAALSNLTPAQARAARRGDMGEWVRGLIYTTIGLIASGLLLYVLVFAPASVRAGESRLTYLPMLNRNRVQVTPPPGGIPVAATPTKVEPTVAPELSAPVITSTPVAVNWSSDKA